MKYSLLFRVWHWLNAVVVLGLVATVLLRWTLLAKTQTANLLVEQLALMEIFISYDQGVLLVKSLRIELWEWHITLGFAFTVLVVLRLYLHFVDSKKRVAFTLLGAYDKLLHIAYCALYAVFGIMTISGLLLYFSQELSLAKGLTHNIKNLHQFFYYYIAFFIPLHIGAVFLNDAINKNSLVSGMIHGKDFEEKN